MLYEVITCPKDFSSRLGEAWQAGGWTGLEGMLRALPRAPAARVLLWAVPEADPELRDKRLQEGLLFSYNFV